MRINFACIWRLQLVVLALLVACGLVACTAGGNLLDDADVETQIAASVAAPLTAVSVSLPTITPIVTEPPAPATPVPTVTPPTTTPPPSKTASATQTATSTNIPAGPVPASSLYPDVTYVLDQESLFGKYTARIWRNAAMPDGVDGFDRLLTLELVGAEPIQIEEFYWINPLSGTDFTGDGVPELAVETFSGGPYCCLGTIIYSLGDTPELLLATPPASCIGNKFSDLDGDGILEFITCDDNFRLEYCPVTSATNVTVFLAYSPEANRYQAASPRFADQYSADLPEYTAQAESAQPGQYGEWDGTTKCVVLPLILALLYSGQIDQAWSEFARVYTFPDATVFRQDIERAISTSQLFTLP